MASKLSSRKFWICIAALLGSLGTGITGLIQGNETCAIVGGVCTVVSGAIYCACEAYVDGASVKTNTSSYSETINVQSTTKEDAVVTAAAKKIDPEVAAPVVAPPDVE